MTGRKEDTEAGALPALTPRDFQQALQEEQQAIAAAKQGYWPPGAVDLCPECRQKTFVGRDDLVVEVARPPLVYVFRGIRGAECSACRTQCVESADLALIEEKVADVPDFQVKISSLAGGRSLGTYWPADVVRNMGLSPGEVASLQMLSRSTALLRIERSASPVLDGRKRVVPTARRKRRRATR